MFDISEKVSQEQVDSIVAASLEVSLEQKLVAQAELASRKKWDDRQEVQKKEQQYWVTVNKYLKVNSIIQTVAIVFVAFLVWYK